MYYAAQEERGFWLEVRQVVALIQMGLRIWVVSGCSGCRVPCALSSSGGRDRALVTFLFWMAGYEVWEIEEAGEEETRKPGIASDVRSVLVHDTKTLGWTMD